MTHTGLPKGKRQRTSCKGIPGHTCSMGHHPHSTATQRSGYFICYSKQALGHQGPGQRPLQALQGQNPFMHLALPLCLSFSKGH